MNLQAVKCKMEGCTSPAVGYVPLDEDFHVCDQHFDEKQHEGQIVCFLNEEICPKCQGRCLRSLTLKCLTCGNTGVVEKQQPRRCCTKCKGTGEAPPIGRPRGSVKKGFEQPAALAA